AIAGPLNGYPDEGDCLARGFSNTRYVSKRMGPKGKTLVIRQGLMGYGTGPTIIPEGLPIWVPGMDVIYRWENVPDAGVPWGAITLQEGTVNDFEPWQKTLGVNTGSFDGAPAGTLLYDHADPQPDRDAFGNRVWSIEYHFYYLPNVDSTGFAKGH